jgi:hypothetical protein
MDLKIDVRFLLLPLANLFFSHYTSAIIITLFLLFVSIKVPVSLQLTTSSLLRVQAIDLSVSVIICFLCLNFMSTPHFWIVNSILILCLSPWDDLLFEMLKILIWWLFHSLRSIGMHEVLCVFNGSHDDEEAHLGVDQQEELSWEPDDHFIVVDVYDQLESE